MFYSMKTPMGLKRTFFCKETLVGFAMGCLVSYIGFENSQTTFSEATREYNLTVIKKDQDKNVDTSQANKLQIVPSLQEDWAQVECPLTSLSPDDQNLFDYLSETPLVCDKKVMLGGKFYYYGYDGEKWCCLDKGFDFKISNCIVLSFGISDDWTFDDTMDKVFGCQVFAFDPTINLPDHQRSSNIKFFNMGISDEPGKLGYGKVDQYSNILKMLHLENSVIDYLKMDVEEAEFKFLNDVLTNDRNLLKNVRQIGMEIHLTEGKNFNPEAWRYFQQLECLGFRLMFSNFNPSVEIITVNGKRRTTVYEIVWGQDRKWVI